MAQSKTVKRKRANVIRDIEDIIEPHPHNRRRRPISETHPDIAAEWCYRKNCGFGPEEFSAGSNVKVWWQCPNCEVEYQARILNRTSISSGCAICNRGITTDLRDFPRAYKEFDRIRNKGVDPHKLPLKTKVHWTCIHNDSHRWVAAFERKRDGKRCPDCRGIRPSKTNNLGLMRKLAKQFHPTKNGTLKPKDLQLSSRQQIWWKCPEGPDHEWQAEVNTRTKNGGRCSFCINKFLSVTNCLATLFPDVAKTFHPKKNGTLTPCDVIATSHTKCWWKCPEGPDHEWQAGSVERTQRKQGCPCCSNKKLSVTNSLEIYPDVAAEFHLARNKPVKPRDIVYCATAAYWWRCTYCAVEWSAPCWSRTKYGPGCRPCKAKLRKG